LHLIWEALLPLFQNSGFMPSFDNTEIAFEGKSNTELKRAHFLFNVIGKKWVVVMGKKFTGIAFALHLPIKFIIKATIFKQFVGGESINDCEKTMESLHKFGIGTILDYSVEGKEEEESFDAAEKEILRTIEKAKADERIAFSVFKVSGLGRHYILEKRSKLEELSIEEKQEWDRIYKRVFSICNAAHNIGRPIFVDAEESWIQPAIDELALEMMRKFNSQKCIIYNTAQLYRHDRLAYIKELFGIGEKENFFVGLKLVRGAYMEKERKRAAEKGYPDPIQPDKASSDRDFNLALQFCIDHVEKIAICLGTHNEESSLKLATGLKQKEIPLDHPHIYFAQLLGMSDHISYNLSKEGYNVAKYVPYGPVKEVVPYLIRRAEENTSVKGQTGRELSLIRKELRRRKLV
jgi:proline dehydrogenase